MKLLKNVLILLLMFICSTSFGQVKKVGLYNGRSIWTFKGESVAYVDKNKLLEYFTGSEILDTLYNSFASDYAILDKFPSPNFGYFNTQNNGVEFMDKAKYNVDTVTIACGFNISSVNSDNRPLFGRSSSSYTIAIDLDGSIDFQFKNPTSIRTVATTGTYLNNNYIAIATYDKTTAHLYIYDNEGNQLEHVSTVFAGSLPATSYNIGIGRPPGNTGAMWTGTAYSAKIYNKVKTYAEYRSEDTTGLVFYTPDCIVDVVNNELATFNGTYNLQLYTASTTVKPWDAISLLTKYESFDNYLYKHNGDIYFNKYNSDNFVVPRALDGSIVYTLDSNDFEFVSDIKTNNMLYPSVCKEVYFSSNLLNKSDTNIFSDTITGGSNFGTELAFGDLNKLTFNNAVKNGSKYTIKSNFYDDMLLGYSDLTIYSNYSETTDNTIYTDVFADVENYGGIGDGATSNSNAIDSALKYNDVILLKKGVFNIDRSINLGDNKKIYIDSATIFLANGTEENIIKNTNFEAGNSNISLIGLGNAILDGNASAQDRTIYGRDSSESYKYQGLYFLNVDNFTARNLSLFNSAAFGWMFHGCNSVDMANQEVYQIDLAIGAVTSNQDGIAFRHGTSNVILNNYYGKSSDDCISLGGFYGDVFTYRLDEKGDCDSIILNDVQISSGTNLVRIIAGDTNTVSNVYMSDMYGWTHYPESSNTWQTLLSISSDTYPTHPPLYTDIININVDSLKTNKYISNSIIYGDHDFSNLTVENIEVNNDWKYIYRTVLGQDIRTVTIDSVDVNFTSTQGGSELLDSAPTTGLIYNP